MLRFLTAGESHGPAVSAIVDGVPAGLPLATDDLVPDLRRRRGVRSDGTPYIGASARMRLERDVVEIFAGVMGGKTIGAPIGVRITNEDHARWQKAAQPPLTVPRPGHADLTGAIKYGHDDLRLSLERASARETAARVAVGAICRRLLAEFGVRVGSYVTDIGGAAWAPATSSTVSLGERLDAAERSPLRCPDEAATNAMESRIREIAAARLSAGGIFDVVALGVPAGLGSYASWDRRLSGRLAAAVASVPAIKGVEIGDGFRSAANPLDGRTAHDHLHLADDGDTILRTTNHAGGIEGGISTGEAIVIRAAMKPIATTVKPQPSVDLAERTAAETSYQRSDICAVPRAAVVAEAMVCFVLADALVEKLGGDSLDEMRPRFEALGRNRCSDLPMRSDPAVYWE